MKIAVALLSIAILGINNIPAISAIAHNEHTLSVTCIATEGDMLDITLDGRSRSAIKSTNLSVIAIPNGNAIAESKTHPMGSDATLTDKFSLFVAPYSLQTTGIKVVGDIESANGKLTINTAANCQ